MDGMFIHCNNGFMQWQLLVGNPGTDTVVIGGGRMVGVVNNIRCPSIATATPNYLTRTRVWPVVATNEDGEQPPNSMPPYTSHGLLSMN